MQNIYSPRRMRKKKYGGRRETENEGKEILYFQYGESGAGVKYNVYSHVILDRYPI